MNKKTKDFVIVMVIVAIVFSSLFGVPLIFSIVTGVPYWFLVPLKGLSILPLERSMYMEVSPIAPTLLGETITVRVIDSENNTPVQGAKIVALKDGGLSIEKTTDASGVATFSNMGATTIIYASRDGYSNADPFVIPQIPDAWVMTRYYNIIASTLSALALIATVVGLLRRSDRATKRKNRKRST